MLRTFTVSVEILGPRIDATRIINHLSDALKWVDDVGTVEVQEVDGPNPRIRVPLQTIRAYHA